MAPHEARDGLSLSMQNKTRPVVSASQILELPINAVFVKLELLQERFSIVKKLSPSSFRLTLKN